MNDFSINYEELWEADKENMKRIMNKEGKPQMLKDILEILLKHKEKLEKFAMEGQRWISTKEACKRYGIKRQSLHQSHLVPEKKSNMRSYWNVFDLKVWRSNIDSKRKK